MSTSKVDWQEAGRGWGARATEWAYLWEPYALPANEVLFDRLGVDAGVRLLDIACGSGFATSVAAAGAPWSQDRCVRTTHQRLPRRGRLMGAFGPGTCSPCPSPMTASISPPVSTGSGRAARVPSKRRGGTGPRGPFGPHLLGPIRAPGTDALLPQGHRVVSTQPRHSNHGTRRHAECDRGHVEGCRI